MPDQQKEDRKIIRAKKNKYIGSSFDDFLKEEGILEEVKVTALKRVISFLLQKEGAAARVKYLQSLLIP